MRTGFFWDERCFWHSGGDYAFMAPVGGLVQPMAGGGLPENPETKRRLKNLCEVTGLWRDLDMRHAPPATRDDLLRVHTTAYIDRFHDTAVAGGGELGLRAPFGADGFDIACLSAGLAKAALSAVLRGDLDNAYALSRPPGHHCLPDMPNGFCLLNNIAIAIEAARAAGHLGRVAVVDWDVHHGNGTEAIYYEDAETLTVSLHQERNYPRDTGAVEDQGAGPGIGANVNVPLPPGAGHDSYLFAWDRIVEPAVTAFRPEAVVIACGYDASGVDPLSRMLAGSHTFRALTERAGALAKDLCGGRLVLVHEGGYSELHVPFCAHAVLEVMCQSAVTAPDPLAARIEAQQPGAAFAAFAEAEIEDIARILGL